MCNKYRKLFYDARGTKRIPSEIFSADLHTRQSFFMGYYSAVEDSKLYINNGAIGSAGLFYLMRSLGYQVSINTCSDNVDVYKLNISSEKNMHNESNIVKKIEALEGNENEYIYDIQTENHHFAAGVGQLVVHNSNYISFPHLKTAQESWDYAEKVADEVSALFPPPINL